MRDRITEPRGLGDDGPRRRRCVAIRDSSRQLAKEFRRRLFSKIVPNVKSLGLLSDRQRARFAALGILEFEHNTTSDLDQEAEEEQRRQQVAA